MLEPRVHCYFILIIRIERKAHEQVESSLLERKPSEISEIHLPVSLYQHQLAFKLNQVRTVEKLNKLLVSFF